MRGTKRSQSSFPDKGHFSVSSQRIRRINHRNMEASSRLLQRLKEVFSNIRVVLGFARERRCSCSVPRAASA